MDFSNPVELFLLVLVAVLLANNARLSKARKQVEFDKNAKRFDALLKLQGSLWERYGEMRSKTIVSEDGVPEAVLCLSLDDAQQELLDSAIHICAGK